MRLPASTAGYWRSVRYGRYVAARLRQAKRADSLGSGLGSGSHTQHWHQEVRPNRVSKAVRSPAT